MAEQQRISRGFPFAVFVNEVDDKQRISRGVFVNETIAATGAARPVKLAGPWGGFAGESGGFAG